MQDATESNDAPPMGGSVLWRHVTAAAARRAGRATGGEQGTTAPARAAALKTPEKIAANAVGRAAGRVHGLPLFFDRVALRPAALAELPELIPERALILAVEGPAEAMGIVAICPGLLTSLIETQTSGRLSSRSPPTRRPTRADAAICGDFVDACLAELGEDLSALPVSAGMRGFRHASFLDDPRLFELLLEDGAFTLLCFRLRAGDAGQRDGCLVIALPAAVANTAPAIAAADRPAADSPTRDGSGEGSLAGVVEAVPVELVGTLCRRMLSLGELERLAPGDVIGLPPDALGLATLETATGQVLLRGKLGELGGRHALRLTLGADRGGGPPARSETIGPVQARHVTGPAGAPAPADAHEPPIADLGGPDAFRGPASGPGPMKAGDADPDPALDATAWQANRLAGAG